MIKPSVKFMLFLLSMGLTACSSLPSLTSFMNGPSTTAEARRPANQENGTFVTNTGTAVPIAAVKESNRPLGGEMAQSMDSIDKSKLTHALEGPLGKAAHWANANTGIRYTVAPMQKVTINGNSLCRKYHATAVKGGRTQQVDGTACISTDGNWHPI